MVYNAGNTSATIQQHVITDGAVAIELNFDNCPRTLRPNKGCLIAGFAAVVTHMCRIIYTGGDLRGTVAVYNDNILLHSSDMR
jgi:hypothetical protein